MTDLVSKVFSERVRAAADDAIDIDASDQPSGAIDVSKKLELSETEKDALEDLLSRALASGIRPDDVHIGVAGRRPSAGATADVVLMLDVSLSMTMKLAHSGRKIVSEAEKIRGLRAMPSSNPHEFGQAFPAILSVRTVPPYGYLMENLSPEGYEGAYAGLDKLVFSGVTEVSSGSQRAAGAAVDVLFDVYISSQDSAVSPNIERLYLGRIRDRLESIRHELDCSHVPFEINGVPHKSIQAYVEKITPLLAQATPDFCTQVHGDVHPENILAKVTEGSVGIKFIDPKEWLQSDYIFDIGKLSHYLKVTGPVERGPVASAAVIDSENATLTYEIPKHALANSIDEDLLRRTGELAEKLDDPHWRFRYELSMAANLLGVFPGRLVKSGRDGNQKLFNSAAALLGEGIQHLRRCAEYFGYDSEN